jgi:plastocyanin
MATTVLTPAASTFRSGLYEWLTTTDHKKIGIFYGPSLAVVASLAFGACGGVYVSPSAAATASPSPGGSAAPPAATLNLTSENSRFSAATLEVPADKPFAITFDNQDAGVIHDVGIQESILMPGAALRTWSLIFDGQDVTGPGQATNNVPPLKAGTYKFICTFHPAQMTGELTVK